MTLLLFSTRKGRIPYLIACSFVVSSVKRLDLKELHATGESCRLHTNFTVHFGAALKLKIVQRVIIFQVFSSVRKL